MRSITYIYEFVIAFGHLKKSKVLRSTCIFFYIWSLNFSVIGKLISIHIFCLILHIRPTNKQIHKKIMLYSFSKFFANTNRVSAQNFSTLVNKYLIL